MTEKGKKHPVVEDLSAAEISTILENFPPTPLDMMDSTLKECKERGLAPNTEIMHLILKPWLESDPKNSEIFGNFKLIDRQITIISSTISLWYKDAHGMKFNAFAEDDTDYYVLAHYEDGEVKAKPVSKRHAE
jgi:hypothetical protein